MEPQIAKWRASATSRQILSPKWSTRPRKLKRVELDFDWVAYLQQPHRADLWCQEPHQL